MVVSGGAAGAAYGIGVMKALLDGESSATVYAPLDPDIYTGTSAGAFNAAFMVSQSDQAPAVAIRNLERMWLDQLGEDLQTCGNGVFRFRANPLQYLNLQCLVPNPFRPLIELAGDATFLAGEFFRRGLIILLSTESVERRILKLADLGEFVDIRSFDRNLHRFIDLEGIRRSEKTLRIVATNWRTGESSVFGNADLTDEIGHKLLLGSAALPGVFPPANAAGATYIDGGLVMNTPLKPAVDAGADTIHVVYYDPDVKNLPLAFYVNTLDVLDRSRMVDWATRMNEDIATAGWINDGLELVEGRSRVESPALASEAVRRLIRVVGPIEERIREGVPYRMLTVHRYHPRDDLSGPLGLLNFDRGHLSSLVARGYQDTVYHDCDESQCLLPDRSKTMG
jgi:predicted acylesterase/phospholipase RssA